MKKKKRQQTTSATERDGNKKTFDSRQYIGVLAGILLLSFIAYLPVFQNGFVWDDDLYIQSNTLIQTLNLKNIFSENVAGNYHPLTILVFAIEYQLFGLNETGYHAVNVGIHLLNVVLVYYVVFMLSRKQGVALVTSLLFGIHPLHVESVAWASELKDLLYTFFFLASYSFYLRFITGGQKKFYVIALLLFLFSLLSKAMAVSLPVVFLLTDYFIGREINARLLLEKAPFFIPAFIFGAIAVSVQKDAGATDMILLPVYQRIVFACYGFTNYLIKLIVPFSLSAYYPYPIKGGEQIPARYFFYLFLAAGVLLYMVYSLRISRKIFFGIGFFVVTVFLVLQLLPVGGAVMADRYSYIPSIGIFYLLAEGLYQLWLRKVQWVVTALLGIASLSYTAITYDRCQVWKDGISLWSDVIDKNPGVAMAYCNRGIDLAKKERNAEALSDFNQAILLKNDYAKAYSNRGLIFKIDRKYNEAIGDFTRALTLNPDYISPLYNRGLVLKYVQKYDEALKDFNRVIDLKPDYAEAYNARGIVFSNTAQYEKAVSDFLKAVALQNNYPEAYVNLGNVYSRQKLYTKAIGYYSKAIELNSALSDAYFNRGLAQFNSGKMPESCTDLKQAATLGHPQAKNALEQICSNR